MLIFLQIPYNKYIAKIITFLGPLSFGVYLIHCHPIFIDYMKMHNYDNKPRNDSLISVLNFLFGKTIKTFVFCIGIDYLRHLLFTFLRLKKIFLFIETKMKEKLS